MLFYEKNAPLSDIDTQGLGNKSEFIFLSRNELELRADHKEE